MFLISKKSMLSSVLGMLGILIVISLTACKPIDQFTQYKHLNQVISSDHNNYFKLIKILDQKIIDYKLIDLQNSGLLFTKNKDQLFIANVAGKLKSIDFNGKILWEKSIVNPITAGPVFFEDQVLIATEKAKLFCVSVKTGAIIWENTLNSNLFSAPVISSNMAFMRLLDGSLVVIDLTDGKQLWRFATASSKLTLRKCASPAVSGNIVVAGFPNGKLIAFDKHQGTVLWTHNISNPKGKLDFQRLTDIIVDPIIFNEVVYAISYQGNLVAININTGELLWEQELSCYADLTLHKNRLYCSTKEGKVLAIKHTTGSVIWEQDKLIGLKLSKPVILDKYLILGDQKGQLNFLDLNNGLIVESVLLNTSGIFFSPLIINKANQNYIYTITNEGYSVVLKVNIL